MNMSPAIIRGQRRPKTFASWPYMGIRDVLRMFIIFVLGQGMAREAYMVKKYALETQMKFSPPLRSATSDGITVEVIVASVDVRRLMRESITMMAQNLRPFSNVGGLFSVVAPSWA